MISAQNHLQQLNGNRMKRFLLVLFLILGFQSFGQKYAKIGERAGVKYYMHTVADGETLYGIQQIYGVEVEKIQNPSFGGALHNELMAALSHASHFSFALCLGSPQCAVGARLHQAARVSGAATPCSLP